MLQLKRAKLCDNDNPGYIFINPSHVAVIIPRADIGYGPQCEIGMVNATAWAVQDSAEQVSKYLGLFKSLSGVK